MPVIHEMEMINPKPWTSSIIFEFTEKSWIQTVWLSKMNSYVHSHVPLSSFSFPPNGNPSFSFPVSVFALLCSLSSISTSFLTLCWCSLFFGTERHLGFVKPRALWWGQAPRRYCLARSAERPCKLGLINSPMLSLLPLDPKVFLLYHYSLQWPIGSVTSLFWRFQFVALLNYYPIQLLSLPEQWPIPRIYAGYWLRMLGSAFVNLVFDEVGFLLKLF